MKKVSEHMQELHKVESQYHRAMAKCHGDAMGKAVAGDPMTNFHKSAIAAHNQAADTHDAMCEECAKAISAAELQKSELEPTRISAVTPDAPSVRPVIRTGQREFAASVSPDFSKIIGVNPEDQDAPERSLRQ
jgi:hypothetical protein